MQDHDAHAVEDARVHPGHDLVGDLVVGRVPPPREHVGLGEGLLTKAVLRLFERRHADRHAMAELALEALDDGCVHAAGIDALDRRLAPLVDVLVPDGDSQLAAGRHQIGSASPVR